MHLGVVERVILRRAARKLADGSYGWVRGTWTDGFGNFCAAGEAQEATSDLGFNVYDESCPDVIDEVGQLIDRLRAEALASPEFTLTWFNDKVAKSGQEAAMALALLSVTETS